MKKLLRTVLIVLLVLALLGAGCWYFLLHVGTPSASLYAAYAGLQERSGRYASAAAYYSKALNAEPNHIDYALSANEAYRADNNYTKAEYILVSAIGNNPNQLSLYLSLSQTYVEQDKLLDAERLISACANESIQLQLESMRPAAPVIEPNGGYSADFTTCSISGTDVYYSTTAEYPSLEDGAYQDPISLGYGVTVVSALTVSADGLVSPLTTAEFTVCGPIEEVAFQDEAFDAMMRELFEKDRHDTFLSTELWDLQEMTIDSEDVSLNDLSTLIRLEHLTLKGSYDLSVLASLPLLNSLTISDCTLKQEDLEAIGQISTLTYLTIRDCNVASLDALSSLSTLTYLDASDNQIENLSALTDLTSLTELHLENNPIKSLKALSGLDALTTLDVSGCQIQKLTPLADKTTLTTLDVSDNDLTGLAALKSCTSLTSLDASDNKIQNLSPIANLTSLQDVKLANNRVKTLPTFSADSTIMTLDLSGNRLKKVDALQNLSKLGYLNISRNQVSDLTALADLSSLYQIDAYDNKLTKAGRLDSSDIIVNYKKQSSN